MKAERFGACSNLVQEYYSRGRAPDAQAGAGVGGPLAVGSDSEDH